MKIEIETIHSESGSKTFRVTRGDSFARELLFDEMIGLLISLTVPEKPRYISWMKTQEQWDRQDAKLK